MLWSRVSNALAYLKTQILESFHNPDIVILCRPIPEQQVQWSEILEIHIGSWKVAYFQWAIYKVAWGQFFQTVSIT